MFPPPPRHHLAEGSDTSVQATNDDAQLSKASCARQGYFKDEFIGFFVRKATRRSPLINRGYYSRHAGIRLLLRQFLSASRSAFPDQPPQILSLGAGFDTTWFQLKTELDYPLRYVEVDFSEVTKRKTKIIQAQTVLKQLLDSDPTTTFDPVSGSVASSQYSLHPVDLRDLPALQQVLDKSGFCMTAPTLVLSECVLVYMDPAASTGLLTWLSGHLPTAACIIYEQINPHDAFGRQMVSNLQMRGCPLKGLHHTPTLEAHRQRLISTGWQRADATDMDTVYRLHLDPADKRRIEGLEIFDEYEEWHMIQEHYCIAVGINDQGGALHRFGFGKAATRQGPPAAESQSPALQL